VVVTAAHDRDPGVNRRPVTADRRMGAWRRAVFRHCNNGTLTLFGFLEEGDDIVYCICSKDDVYVRESLCQCGLFFLGHTSSDTQQQVGLFLF